MSRRWWPARRERRSERPRGSTAQGDGRSIADEIGRPSPDDAWRRPRGQLETSLAEARGERDANGHARGRLVQTNGRAGALRVSDRRVEERTGETRKFSSRVVPPTLVGPRKERGPPPLFAWVVHRGGGPGSRGRLRLVGRALLGDHTASEVSAGRDRAFSAVTSETSTLSRAPPSESSYVRLEKTRLSVSSSSGCASIDGELVPIADDDRSRPTLRPVSSLTGLPPTPPWG